MAQDEDTVHDDGPSGGFGALKGVARIFGKEWATPMALETLRCQKKPGAFMCVSCAWTKPEPRHPAEFCENGAKATLWEHTTRTCMPDFFAKHTVTELRGWKDYDLEQAGRLNLPVRCDRATDKHVPGVRGLTVTPFDLPDGTAGAYYPEMNPLIPLWHHDRLSKTPAAKGVPVRIVVQADAA